MKIAFLLGSPDISGGTNVIFEHAIRISRSGHPVTIITEEEVTKERYSWHPTAHQLVWKTFGELEGEYYDLAIATWWQSVFQLARVRSRKYLYFVQSIESRFFEKQDVDNPSLRDVDILSQWCENTYRIKLPVITEARWIQQYLLEHHNSPSFLVRNGIRKEIHCEHGRSVARRQAGRLRVLVEGPLGVFFKNVEKTISLCRQSTADEVWLLTSSAVSAYPGVDRCFSRVPIEQTAAIYRSCDVLVKLSYVEGMFGPPLEMFHCGGTAIVYDVTGHDEYIRHEENSLVVAKDDEDAVVAGLNRLKNDQELLNSLKARALQTALTWPGWDEAADRFLQVIENCEQNCRDISPTFLTEQGSFLLAIRDNALRAREIARLEERERLGCDSAASFLNHIQVYWDCGRGMEAVLTGSYYSGSWDRCTVIVPCLSAPRVLRVDPSVRIGVVEIRSLRITGADSARVFAHWYAGGSWQDLAVAGTACILQLSPNLLIEAYGEDPQVFLPGLANLPDGEYLNIEVELRELGFAQALALLYPKTSQNWSILIKKSLKSILSLLMRLPRTLRSGLV